MHTKNRLPTSPYRLLVLLLIALYIATFGVLTLREHLAFETNVLDLGNYDQAMWNASEGRGFAFSLKPKISLNRMGVHVEPTLFLLVPLYWLWASPVVLLWAQTVALGVAAWPLFLLAHKRLRSEPAAAAISAAYLLLPATQSVNMFDFHAVALSPPLMLGAIYFLDKGLSASGGPGFFQWNWRIWQIFQSRPTPQPLSPTAKRAFAVAAVFFILAMGTKEDVPLHVFMVGVYVWLFLRRGRIGWPLMIVGLLWAFIAFGVIIPNFRIGGEQSAYVNYFPTLGDTPLEIALSPLVNPVAVLELVFRPANIAAFGMLTLPWAGLNLLAWPIFGLTAPSLAISFLSNNPLQQELETWHYAAPILPFISLAAVDGLGRLIDWLKTQTASQRTALLGVALLLTASGSYHILRGYSPLALPFHWPEPSPHHQLGRTLAHELPLEAYVVAQAELVPHLSQREQARIWTGPFPPEADYIFLDVAHPRFVNQDNAQGNLLSGLVHDRNFGVVTMQDGYLILERGAPLASLEPTLQSFIFADPRLADGPTLAQFGDLARLVKIDTHTYRHHEPQVTLYFEALRRPTEEYFLHLYLLNAENDVIGATVFKQPALVWWPPQLWNRGDVLKIRFNTLPWWTGDGEHNQFRYAVAFSASDDPWATSQRLTVQGSRTLPDNLAHVQDFHRLAGMVYAR